ncbi:ABC transporter permease [Arenimonas sp.]|uniref:ABC transporter permease n=1 Tax=Arenimonas sp. TaxID=1872635 RepID=UPI0039E21E1B
MRTLALAWRQLRRDLAAGEIRILLAALVLAVMAVTAVGLLTDRAERALAIEANRLLGGDAVLRGDQAISPQWFEMAKERGLRQAQTRSFNSMVRVGDDLRLGEVRAISEGFPLRGEFVLREGEADRVARAVPSPGSAWMTRSGADTLGARVGDTVLLGSAEFRLAALVVQEPDAALDYFSNGPKVFINLTDLPATGLEQPGSRIAYRLVVAGDAAAVDGFVAEAKSKLGRGQRLETAADARPEIRSALDRAGRFLGLAALVAVVLAAIAVAMAARRHSARHLAGSAVMRCLGASQRTLAGIHVGELLMLGVMGSAIGLLFAYGLQAAVAAWLSKFLGVAIPAAGWQPMAAGLGVGMTVLLAFGAPPVLALRRVPALRVLRRDVDFAEPSAWAVALLALSGLGALLWWKAGSPALASAVLAGIVGTLAVLGVLAFALILLLRRLRKRMRGPWRYGLANLSRRMASSVAQISSLGLGLMVLLLLTFVRTDLLSRWQQSLPENAPNRFLVNVQSDQLDDVKRHLIGAGIRSPQLYPMIRGRLVEVNGKPVTGEDYAGKDERTRRRADREFNLSVADRLRKDNEVVEGKFWPTTGAREPEVSVEQDFAASLGWRVGDRVAFDIAGQRFEARISNLRKVEWESFQPNFFVIASPGSMDGYPASYIGGIHVPKSEPQFTNRLVSAFPNLTVVDIDAVLDQVRRTVQQVTTVVEAVFYFSLIAGVLVLLATVSASQDERLLETAVMRVLGGSRRQLMLAQATEFAAIGLLAGATAAIAATVLAGVVAQQVFDLPWTADWRSALISAGVGMLAAVVAGMLATRRVLSAPPSVTLRELQQ